MIYQKYRNTLLLFVAILITIMVFVPLLIRRTWLLRNSSDIGQYHFDIAYHLDKLGGLLIWGVPYTISALVYEKNKLWAITIINWIFNDELHCYNAWVEEF